MAIFTASAVGYVDNPPALFARSLAWGLVQRGHDVRMLEERRNQAIQRTLKVVGSDAFRQTFESYPGLLMHSFEPRSGAALMEWLVRELSSVDVAIAVDGLPVEIGRWIANLDHPALCRLYLVFEPARLTDVRAHEVELDRFDGIYSAGQPTTSIEWQPLSLSITDLDVEHVSQKYRPDIRRDVFVSSDVAAQEIESAIDRVGVRRR